APGSAYKSSPICRPTHSFGSFFPPPKHFSCWHEPLSHWSSLSHSSPSPFLASAHWPPEHEPLVHSSSLWHSSPPLFFSAHLPPTHELLVHWLSLSQSWPIPFLALHPGKSGGHSAVCIRLHCLGGSWPGNAGGAPAIDSLMGTEKGLLRLPDVATGSFCALKP